ncbi:hypothetical protein CC85DRAFT_124864 [Cutaneotrichosporon oleaginosum]|uniref:Uncharacterized protein n=1 Tax=Cutaneotrichosporon oleaginosum TaxID=879819 RepID=A0A0J0XJL3_9TREE|nr:uncharacterized protein CC85DRAFT_124864 [Cutaneotrichosporon oleaginosum]KLT41287.1 hypothetical protein CC85DRAFT_124864 [Cutaneotrichosporon oleaginosum]TXT14037.1 hypothetical protein COLE_00230 [Cutaneotrichosporon oleaginosum]
MLRLPLERIPPSRVLAAPSSARTSSDCLAACVSFQPLPASLLLVLSVLSETSQQMQVLSVLPARKECLIPCRHLGMGRICGRGLGKAKRVQGQVRNGEPRDLARVMRCPYDDVNPDVRL